MRFIESGKLTFGSYEKVYALMDWSKKDFSVKNGYIVDESIMGERNGPAYFLMSSLFIHNESTLPFSVIVCKGVIGIVSSTLKRPFKKLVTGKICTLSPESFVKLASEFFP